jgi:hypothetical protein
MMTAEFDPDVGETCFAPAARADTTRLEAQAASVESHPMVRALLEAMPEPAVVVNRQRQIVAANGAMLALLGGAAEAAVLGRRPGEAVGCEVAAIAPAGCGTAEECRYCGAVSAILGAFEQQSASAEAHLRTSVEAGGGAFEFEVKATHLLLAGHDLAVVALRDLSDQKRRRVLERIFFHDVLNTAGGILGLSQALEETDDPAEGGEYVTYLHRLAEQLMDQITTQRQLMAAENGELTVNPEPVAVPDLLGELAALYRHHEVAVGRRLLVGEVTARALVTDRVLLSRILGNLIKNALEATPEGGAVTISADRNEQGVTFRVHNPGVLTPAVRAQLFRRSFSTKLGSGRGLGTFGVKLFAERHLHGQVDFESAEPMGTTFIVTLPRLWPKPPPSP